MDNAIEQVVTTREMAQSISNEIEKTPSTIEGWIKDAVESGELQAKNVGTPHKRRFIVNRDETWAWVRKRQAEKTLGKRRRETRANERRRMIDLLAWIWEACVDDVMVVLSENDRDDYYDFAKRVSDRIEDEFPEILSIIRTNRQP